jgi:stage III sporulation protein AD
VAELVKVVGLGLIATVLLVVIREQRAEWGLMLRLASSFALLLLIVPELARVVSLLIRMSELARVPGAYVDILLKVVGIAYITMLAAHVAYDSNEAGTGWRIELAGKVVILLLAVPLIASITETLLKLIPS